MSPPPPRSRANELTEAQIEYVAYSPLPHQHMLLMAPSSVSSIKGIAQRLYTSEAFPLVSVKFMLMTWQGSSQVIADVKDPDDEETCPGADGGEVDEEEYNR